MSTDSGRFEAEYRGVCAACELGIKPGDIVFYQEGEVVHVDCPGEPVLREMCPDCFTEKSVVGSCLCG